MDSPIWLQLSCSPVRVWDQGQARGCLFVAAIFFSIAGGPGVGWGSSLGTRKSSSLSNQGLLQMQTLSQQALQHQMGRESSYMIQALIHNSDLLSQSGHEEGRTEWGGKKQEGPRHQKSQSCRLPAHPPPSQPWCGDKPQNKPWPSRSGESQVFRSRPSGPQSRWLRARSILNPD